MLCYVMCMCTKNCIAVGLTQLNAGPILIMTPKIKFILNISFIFC